MSVKKLELSELENKDHTHGKNLLEGNLELIKNVKVKLQAITGDAELTVGDLMDVKPGSVIKLNSELNTPISIVLDGKVIARGNLVAADDNFGIQITEISI